MTSHGGTFVPAGSYPPVLRWVVEVTPLYRSVHLVRGVTTGAWGPVQLVDVVYLMVLFGIGLVVASRRMEKLLCR
jgi:lipooligosaccharide transport system permease protein